MSRCAAVCLILGLVAVGGASAATRQAYTPSAQALVREVVSTLKDWMAPNVDIHPSAYDAFADEEEKFHLVVKFKVPPKHTMEFAKIWLEAKEELEGQEGVQKMKLFKIFTDNTCLVSYQEWDSVMAFKKACKSEKGKKFKEFICEKDIPVCLVGMCPIEKSSPEAFLPANNIADASGFEDEDLHAGMMAPAELEAALGGHLHRVGGEEECKPTVISKYCVLPSCKDKFVKEFTQLKSKVLEGEKGVKCYGLAKTMSDNFKYVGYEEWESKQALHEHIKSDNFKEFCAFVHENNVPMQLAMAIPIESMEQLEIE